MLFTLACQKEDVYKRQGSAPYHFLLEERWTQISQLLLQRTVDALHRLARAGKGVLLENILTNKL